MSFKFRKKCENIRKSSKNMSLSLDRDTEIIKVLQKEMLDIGAGVITQHIESLPC